MTPKSIRKTLGRTRNLTKMKFPAQESLSRHARRKEPAKLPRTHFTFSVCPTQDDMGMGRGER